MTLKAYKVEKVASKSSFETNRLMEYILEEEDLDLWFACQQYDEFFVWICTKDIKNIERYYDIYVTEYEENNLPEDVYFTKKDVAITRQIIDKIKEDLGEAKEVIYVCR